MLARRLVLLALLALNITLLYALIWGGRGAIAYNELKSRCDVLEKRIHDINERNLELSKEIRLLQSDEKYIEKTIRNRLNFVRNNEILYIFPEEDTAEPAGALPNEAEN